MSTRTWSTCAECGGLVAITDDWSQVNHPACKRDTRSALADDYRAAVERGDTTEADRLEATLASHDRDDHDRSLAKSALWYARRNWPVFPLRPGDKRPLTRHGVLDATTDLDRVRQWWKATPAANIGVATGVMFDVLDVDWTDKSGDPSGAQSTWPQLRDSGALPDIHGIAITPRSGLHILVQPQGWANQVKAQPGLDVRGRGGYIVVAPSRYRDAGQCAALQGGGEGLRGASRAGRSPHPSGWEGRQPAQNHPLSGRFWQWVVRPSPRITDRPDWPNGVLVEPDQPAPVEADQARDFPLDPDTGQVLDQWRVTGQHVDEQWQATEWWQRPRRSQPRSRWAS